MNHGHREWTYGCQGEQWERWIGILGLVEADLCRYSYIEWMNNKVLLYSTGDYSQYPVINNNGKECKKECIYICIYITESLCCRAEITIVNQLYSKKY